MSSFLKIKPVRDKKWLVALRDYPSVITGLPGPTVEAMHLGTLGRGIKIGDDNCLPVEHHFHLAGHNSGEISMLRKHLPDYILREALRLYAQKMYKDRIT